MANSKYNFERLETETVLQVAYEGENRYRQKVKINQSLYNYLKYNGLDWDCDVTDSGTSFIVIKNE